jgi:hypothetical protein
VQRDSSSDESDDDHETLWGERHDYEGMNISEALVLPLEFSYLLVRSDRHLKLSITITAAELLALGFRVLHYHI